LDSSVEYFKKKINDHLIREMEIMVEMFEANNLTNEEWKEIKESILKHPWAEIVKIMKSGIESKGNCRKTEED